MSRPPFRFLLVRSTMLIVGAVIAGCDPRSATGSAMSCTLLRVNCAVPVPDGPVVVPDLRALKNDDRLCVVFPPTLAQRIQNVPGPPCEAGSRWTVTFTELELQTTVFGSDPDVAPHEYSAQYDVVVSDAKTGKRSAWSRRMIGDRVSGLEQYALGELVANAIETSLADAGAELEPVKDFKGPVRWGGRVRPSGTVGSAPAKRVASEEGYAYAGEVVATAARRTHAELDSPDGLERRIARVAGALGASHFFVRKVDAGTQADPLWISGTTVSHYAVTVVLLREKN